MDYNEGEIAAPAHLGEFEQLILLAILRLGDDAYVVTIRAELETHGGAGRSVRAGMAACAMLSAGGEALLIGFGGPAVWRDPSNTDFFLLCTAGLIAAIPLLTGAAVARHRLLWEQYR